MNLQERTLEVKSINIAIINALRTLQDRVGKLETEKQLAKEKITILEDELSTTRTLLFRQQQQQKDYQSQKCILSLIRSSKNGIEWRQIFKSDRKYPEQY
jgi:molecular chaperone GrpE (heat shock protein)